jgi:Ca-activated chloride channel family protein
VERTGIDIVIALDISRSMQAADVAPSRAAAAASGLQSMLDHLGGDRVGLVTFGGSAFARSPLTLDVDAIADLVTRAQREGALVRPGSDIGGAISESLRLLDVPDRSRTQVIVLVSDGEDLAQNAPGAIEAAKREQVPIYTVAAGTEQGGLVPPGENARPDAPGVVSRADRAALARIADETGGSTRDIPTLAGLAVDFSRLRQSQLDADSQGVPIERFQWVVGAALSLLLVQTVLAEAGNLRVPRRPRASVAVTSLLCIALIAGCGGTAAYQQVREGNEAFEREDFTQALSAYQEARRLTPEDPILDYNMGNAFHRLERYGEASTAFTDALKKTKDGALFTRATYGIGNAAFSQGTLEAAREAYVGVLQRDPTDADARHNLEVVLRALGQQAAAPPTPAAGGEQPTASPTPAASGPGTPQPTASPSPAGSPGPGGQPGVTPGSGPGSGAVLSEAEARAELERLLRELPEGLTAEEALRILDAARRASELGTLQRGGGATPDPNDR